MGVVAAVAAGQVGLQQRVIGGAGLLGPAEAFEFAPIVHQSFKTVIEPLSTPQRQLEHFITKMQGILKPQQGAVEQGVANPVP